MRQIDRLHWSGVILPRYQRSRRGLFSILGRNALGWDVIQGEIEPVVSSTNERAKSWAFAPARELCQDDTRLNSLAYVIADRLLELDCVRSIYFNFDEDQTVINVWAILQEASDGNRRKVYEKELELIDEFPNLIFNFRTTDVSGEKTPASSDYRCLTK